ncbi:MAG: hypothetical protein ACRDWG_20470 [Actinomycetes bacterium]|nr:hypothetical protein [Actinomycetes bacterium]
MIWIVIYAVLAVATLGLIAITGWRVFVAARQLGLTVQRSQQRVGEVMPPLQAALEDMQAYEAQRHSPGGYPGGNGGNPGAHRSKISRAEQLARWDSIRPAPWTTDGRQAGHSGTAQDGPDQRSGHRADQRG